MKKTRIHEDRPEPTSFTASKLRRTGGLDKNLCCPGMSCAVLSCKEECSPGSRLGESERGNPAGGGGVAILVQKEITDILPCKQLCQQVSNNVYILHRFLLTYTNVWKTVTAISLPHSKSYSILLLPSDPNLDSYRERYYGKSSLI